MIHAKEFKYQNRVVEINGHHWAVPIDVTLDDANLIVNDDRKGSETFVRLHKDYDLALRELALRLHRDEWHLAVRSHSQFGWMSIFEKQWAVYDGAGASEAFEEAIQERKCRLHVPMGLESFINWDDWFAAERRISRGQMLATFDEYEVVITVESDIGPLDIFIYRTK